MWRLTSGFEITGHRNGDLEIYCLSQNRSIIFSGVELVRLRHRMIAAVRRAFEYRTSVNKTLTPILEQIFRR